MTDWAPEYPCLAADPPWNETGGGKVKRGADRWYATIKKKEDILRVMVQAPCWRPAANAHLWLWATNNFLADAIWLMAALDFRYVTHRAWAKMERELRYDSTHAHLGPDGGPLSVKSSWKPQKAGLGQYIFGQHELLLFGVRGRLPALWKGEPCAQCGKPLRQKACGPTHAMLAAALPKPINTLLLAPRTNKHSEKPAQAYEDIERVSPGPRLEMFARVPKFGWDAWGNEVEPKTLPGPEDSGENHG